MLTHSHTPDDPLEAATHQIRTLCGDAESLPSPLDHRAMGRMLVHIANISRSVVASTQDHVNAAKRLNDFALVFARVAKNSQPPDGPVAIRMTSVSDKLRAASEVLSRADAIPAWRAPGPGAS
jgi:hypothetical protein